MTKPLRMLEPDKIYLVTNRTIQGRLLLKPSPRLNQIIGGVLARLAKQYNVKIFFFFFASNHFHIILQTPAATLPKFMSAFQSKMAKEVGRLHDWRDKLWARRYSAEAILDDQALLDKVAYIFSHGVKEGFVDESRQWPGLIAIPELCNGVRRRFPWINRTGIYNAQRRNKGPAVKESDHVEKHVLEVAVPVGRGCRSRSGRKERDYLGGTWMGEGRGEVPGNRRFLPLSSYTDHHFRRAQLGGWRWSALCDSPLQRFCHSIDFTGNPGQACSHYLRTF